MKNTRLITTAVNQGLRHEPGRLQLYYYAAVSDGFSSRASGSLDVSAIGTDGGLWRRTFTANV